LVGSRLVAEAALTLDDLVQDDGGLAPALATIGHTVGAC
jgi:hypothetical protein